MTRLSLLREAIASVDERLIATIGERMLLVRAAGREKAEVGAPVLDPAREAAVVSRASALARASGLPQDEIRALFWRLIAMSRRVQLDDRSSPDPGMDDRSG